MKIRSMIPSEPEGRTITLGRAVYVFKPDADGNNVCDVPERAHVQRLISIDEGTAYEIVDPSLATAARPVVVKAVTVKAADDPFANPKDDIIDDDASVPSDAVLNREHVDEPEAPPVRKGPKYNGLTRKQLEAAYTKKFGKAAPKSWRDDTLVAKLSGE